MADLSNQKNLNFAVTGEVITNTYIIFQDSDPSDIAQTFCKHCMDYLIANWGDNLNQIDAFHWECISPFLVGHFHVFIDVFWVNNNFECKPFV
jgi:hypothetical protein